MGQLGLSVKLQTLGGETVGEVKPHQRVTENTPTFYYFQIYLHLKYNYHIILVEALSHRSTGPRARVFSGKNVCSKNVMKLMDILKRTG